MGLEECKTRETIFFTVKLPHVKARGGGVNFAFIEILLSEPPELTRGAVWEKVV